MEMQLQISLKSTLDGGGWSASSFSYILPGERALGSYWVGGWLGPRVGVNTAVTMRNPSRESSFVSAIFARLSVGSTQPPPQWKPSLAPFQGE